MKILAVPAMAMNLIQMLILVCDSRGFAPFLVVPAAQAQRLIAEKVVTLKFRVKILIAARKRQGVFTWLIGATLD